MAPFKIASESNKLLGDFTLMNTLVGKHSGGNIV